MGWSGRAPTPLSIRGWQGAREGKWHAKRATKAQILEDAGRLTACGWCNDVSAKRERKGQIQNILAAVVDAKFYHHVISRQCCFTVTVFAAYLN
jgi:hypothetical protein